MRTTNVEVWVPFDTNNKASMAVMKRMEEKIFEATEKLPFAAEIVVSHVHTNCVDRSGKARYTLRICSTNPEYIRSLVMVLGPFGYDVETLVMGECHEAVVHPVSADGDFHGRPDGDTTPA